MADTPIILRGSIEEKIAQQVRNNVQARFSNINDFDPEYAKNATRLQELYPVTWWDYYSGQLDMSPDDENYALLAKIKAVLAKQAERMSKTEEIAEGELRAEILKYREERKAFDIFAEFEELRNLAEELRERIDELENSIDNPVFDDAKSAAEEAQTTAEEARSTAEDALSRVVDLEMRVSELEAG
jgi:hypothetical protein